MLNTLSFNNMFHSVSMSGFSIGSLHPYSVFVIVNLSISSSLLGYMWLEYFVIVPAYKLVIIVVICVSIKILVCGWFIVYICLMK